MKRRRNTRRSIAVTILASLALSLPAASAAYSGPSPQPQPANVLAPALAGTPAVGQTLSCSTGEWANDPTGYAYAWLRNGIPIGGQTGRAYVVQSADRGSSIACQVIATNSGGEYTITGLPSGSYDVRLSATSETGNYLVAPFYDEKSSFSEATPVTVDAPGTTAGVDAGASAGGQIAGEVTAAGAGIAGVDVCALPEPNGGGCRTATTNAAGEYKIPGLSSGSYEVEFSYYQGVSGGGIYAPAVDHHVPVGAPGTTEGVNAEVRIGGRIAGKVTGAGAGLADIEVCADEATGGSSSDGPGFLGCASTNAGGEYALTGLPAGSYYVEFSSASGTGDYMDQYYDDKPSSEVAEAVAVELEATTGIDTELQPGGQIQGKVLAAEGGVPLAGIDVCAGKAEGGFGAPSFSHCATSDAAGEYAIGGLVTGSYEVQFSADRESGNYATQYYSDKLSSSEAEAVPVLAGSTTPPIDAELRVGGQIRGEAVSASGAGLADADVCATEAGGPPLGDCAETDAAGEYTISGLRTGSYGVSLYLYTNEQGYSAYISQSRPDVAVTEGGSTSEIDFALAPGGQIAGRVADAAGVGVADVEVCAERTGGEGELRSCAITDGGGGSASANSGALRIPGAGQPASTGSHSAFRQAHLPRLDAKTRDLDFFFSVATAGRFSWSLFFGNADIGFAGSLRPSSAQADLTAFGLAALTGAEAAQKTVVGRAARCRKGQTKHRGRCVAVLVPFGSGSHSASPGTVEIAVHPSARAMKALKAGRALHVSGAFAFQSVLGGPSVTHSENVTIRLPKPRARRR